MVYMIIYKKTQNTRRKDTLLSSSCSRIAVLKIALLWLAAAQADHNYVENLYTDMFVCLYVGILNKGCIRLIM